MQQAIRSMKSGERFRLFDAATAYVSERVYIVGRRKGCIVCCHKTTDTRVTLHIHQDVVVIGMKSI